jgi:hypothetical protein
MAGHRRAVESAPAGSTIPERLDVTALEQVLLKWGVETESARQRPTKTFANLPHQPHIRRRMSGDSENWPRQQSDGTSQK